MLKTFTNLVTTVLGGSPVKVPAVDKGKRQTAERVALTQAGTHRSYPERTNESLTTALARKPKPAA